MGRTWCDFVAGPLSGSITVATWVSSSSSSKKMKISYHLNFDRFHWWYTWIYYHFMWNMLTISLSSQSLPPEVTTGEWISIRFPYVPLKNNDQQMNRSMLFSEWSVRKKILPIHTNSILNQRNCPAESRHRCRLSIRGNIRHSNTCIL